MPHTKPATFFISPLEPRRLLSSYPLARDNDLAFDSTGSLHVAYFDTQNGSLHYFRRNPDGSSTQPQAIDTGGDVGSHVSLALDPLGRPAVAYFESDEANLKFAQFNGTSWDVVHVDSAGRVGLYPSLAFDADGRALISYYDRTRGDLRLAERSGSVWSIRTLDAAADVGRHSSIGIDAVTGRWIVAYERTSDGAVLVARQRTHDVLRKVVDKTRRGAAHLSLRLDSDQLPALSYFDATLADLKFAHRGAL